MKYDFLIVGAGLSGCVLAERIANVLNKKCLIVEQRNHIGGNVYDYYNSDGILVHKYGPHIFHTQMKKVWDYLSQFTDWIKYEHEVLAEVNGKLVPVPFNLNSLDILFPENEAKILTEVLIKEFGDGIKIPILKMLQHENPEINKLANFVYDKIFLGYNLKQWGLRPEELDYSVSSRVPFFISRDNRYFQDEYQAIPKDGYTAMINKIINNKNIEIRLNTDYKKVENEVNYDTMIYTGHIDYFFDFKLGKLPYRTLEFDFVTYEREFFQSKAQINFPNEHNYTRITEFKHITNNKKDSLTTVAYEYPKEYIHGENDPYYPIPKKENQDLFDKYKILAEELDDKVLFVGRLADYKYYNMDQTVGVALQLFEKKILRNDN